MKKIVILLSILVSAELLGQSEFVWQNPLPQGNQLNDLHIFSEDEVIFVGDYGTVMKTTDGGDTWDVKHQVAGLTENLYSICFVGDTGWISGIDGAILKTLDRGENWQHINNIPLAYSMKLQFVDKDTGWIYTGWGGLYKSCDGGETWEKKLDKHQLWMDAAYFIDGEQGWLAGGQQFQGYIMKTVNGGDNWIDQYTSEFALNALNDICFVDSATGFAVGYSGYILKTVNGGDTWDLIYSDSTIIFYSVQFVNANTGWAAGQERGKIDWNAIIMKTTDGGKSWNCNYVGCGRVWDDGSKALSKIKFLNENTSWALPYGSSLILKSENGSESWQPQTSELLENFDFVRFWGPDTGVVFSWAGNPGCDGYNTYRTVDGGATWRRMNEEPASSKLYPTTFLTPDTGYTIADPYDYMEDRHLCKTIDGGKNWTNIKIEGKRDIPLTYWFHNANSGLVLMGSRAIQKTVNGGDTWSIVGEMPEPFLWKVFFIDEDYGWLLSNDSTIIYKTENGGREWQEIALKMEAYELYKIYFVNRNDGWLSTFGRKDKMFKTMNGGIDWIEVPDLYFSAVYFLNENVGWISRSSDILKTHDGGVTWEVLKTNSKRSVESIFALDEKTCWAVGRNGMIIKYTKNEPAVTQLIAQPSVPDNITLSQNYPNPFNPSTTISYSLPQNEYVTLKVYDLLGREINTLVNATQPTGDYSIHFEAGSLASGVYFYELKAGSFVARRKMILLR
ncbi:T9SS type A sorting domain-containing protein [candidate division KSB1 bacterium]|nr:T9SS type A sorting domain-containing protein [candidate division KSB1 bacterium]